MLPAARAAAVALAIALGGCEALPDWLGEAEAPPLPGERISVLALETTPQADPRIADLRVRLPRPMPLDEWPQAGGYPHHAMHHIEAPGPLTRRWKVDIGAGASDDRRLLTAPVIGGQRVFALDAAGVISAYDVATGRRQWRLDTMMNEYEESFGGGLAYGKGWLFVANGLGHVFALDAASGKVIWDTHIDAPVRASPTLSEGRLFVVTFDNQLFALEARSGRRLWNHGGIAETAQLLGAPSPAVASGLVVVTYSSGEIFALRVDNGRPAWSDSVVFSVPTGPMSSLGDIKGSPVIDRDRVYVVSHGGSLVAIELRSGERIWEQDIGSVQTPWVAGDFLYVLTTEGDLLCLSRRDGRIRWVRPLPRFEDPEDRDGPIVWSGPLLVSDRLIVVGSHGEAFSVSPYTGKVMGGISLPGSVSIAPVTAGGTVFLLTNDADLVALR